MAESNSTQAPQQSPKPDPALRRLDAFVGKWNTQGQIKESLLGPAGRLIGTGDAWTFTGESMRFTGMFSDDRKSISGKWEYLSDASDWQHWMDVKLTKAE